MSAATSPRVLPGSLKAWVLAIRPATLTVALAPVLVGAAVAYAIGTARAPAMLAALLGAIFLQIGANIANDVYAAVRSFGDLGERFGFLDDVREGQGVRCKRGASQPYEGQERALGGRS